MHDRLDGMRPEGTSEFFSVDQVSCYEDRILYGFSVTRLEVVIDNRFITMAFQLLNDMASNIPCATSDEYSRDGISLSSRFNRNDAEL